MSGPSVGGEGLRAPSWQCPSGEELLLIGGVEDVGGEFADDMVSSPVERIMATGLAIGGGGGGGNIELG